MLKRPRASSPPPPPPSVPQGTSPEDIIDIHDLKRRRVAPPSLDGQTRGWNRPSNLNSAEDEDEDEDYVAEEAQDGRNEPESTQPSLEAENEEYTAVNSVLKEIHILHKHRQIFLEPVSPLSNTQQDYPSCPETDKNRILYHSEGRTSEESARVYEHYEGTNK